jgi:hypothetical protein
MRLVGLKDERMHIHLGSFNGDTSDPYAMGGDKSSDPSAGVVASIKD